MYVNLIRVRLISHGLFWAFLCFLSGSVQVGFVPVSTIALRTLFILLVNGALAYGNMLWLVPGWFLKGKYVQYMLFLLLFSLPIIAFRFWVESSLFSGTELDSVASRKFYPIILFSSSMAILLLSLGYALAENYFINYTARQRLEKKNLEVETNFLRSQINPHFLFNTLNNVYALSLMQSQKAPDSILKLSQLMRFMLYEAERKEIPVEKEIQYIRDFIDLEVLRFEEKKEVILEVNCLNPQRPIAPLLMIPLIENCFKFANLAQNPSAQIHIRFVEEPDGRIIFQTINTIGIDRAQFQKGGIGLSNLRKRLELLYPGQSLLQTEEKGNQFSATLTIPSITKNEVPHH